MVKIGIPKFMKCLRTFLKKNDGIYILDILIAEFRVGPESAVLVRTLLLQMPFSTPLFPLPVLAYPLILAEQKICGIAGTPLSRKPISDLLNFNVGDTSVVKLHYDIHNEKGGLICDPGRIRRQYLNQLYPPVQHK